MPSPTRSLLLKSKQLIVFARQARWALLAEAIQGQSDHPPNAKLPVLPTVPQVVYASLLHSLLFKSTPGKVEGLPGSHQGML